MDRYLRKYQLVIAKPYPGEYFATQPNAIVVKDLRITFSINKSMDHSPNTAEIKVYNLSDITRREIQVKPLYISLDAGYEGNIQRIFSGDMTFLISNKVGPDWETVIQMGDGSRAMTYASVARSFKSGVKGIDIIKEAATAMGLKVPSNALEATELLQQYAGGYVADGPAHRVMTGVLKAASHNWSIQDGELQIIRPDDAKPGEAVYLDESNGLIAYPKLMAPSKPGMAPRVSVECMLDSRVKVAGRLKVVSKTFNGLAKVEKVNHTGDYSAKGPWSTVTECIIL